MKTFEERFSELFDTLSNGEQVAIYNEYADGVNGERVYEISEFNEIMSGLSPEDVARSCYYGNFRPGCSWFTFNGYGNVESIENVAEWVGDYITDMAHHFERYDGRFMDVLSWLRIDWEDEDGEDDVEDGEDDVEDEEI